MSEKPTKNLLNHLNNSRLIHYLLLFALGWAVVQLLAYFEQVIIVFTFAAIFAFLLNYPVRWLTRFIPHGVAVCIIFLISLVLLGGLSLTIGLAILSQGEELLNQSTIFINSVVPVIEKLEQLLSRGNLEVDFAVIEEQVRNQLFAGIGAGLLTIQTWLSSLIDLILIVVIAFFMLLDRGKIWKFILSFLPNKLQDKATFSIRKNFLGFFSGRLILSVFFGFSSLIVFIILQAPYALFLAAIAGIFDLIPGIGATLGISLVSLILLPQGIWLSIKVLIGCVLLQQVEENLLMPRIMKDSINLNPVVMFFALLIGVRIAGLLGLFLAIPVAGVIINLLEINEIQEES